MHIKYFRLLVSFTQQIHLNSHFANCFFYLDLINYKNLICNVEKFGIYLLSSATVFFSFHFLVVSLAWNIFFTLWQFCSPRTE
jgi:hypothetical protein